MTDAKRATIEAALAKEPVSEAHKELQDIVRKEFDEYKAANRTDIFDSEAWYALQTYDGGDDNTISNLVINKPNTKYQGLFGYTSYATIKNITIDDCQITGSSHVGGVVGYFFLTSSTFCAIK